MSKDKKQPQEIVGKVERVAGPVVEVSEVHGASMLELVEVGDFHLIGEIVRLDGDKAIVQVYEDTTSLTPGAPVYSSGLPLSVELGPGLIGTIYDGVQRPLEAIRDSSPKDKSAYIQRGIHLSSLDRNKKWHFVPVVKKDTQVGQSQIIGTIKETRLIEHRLMVPVGVKGKVGFIAKEADYKIDDLVCSVLDGDNKKDITLVTRWPVRVPRPFKERLPLSAPLITGQRVIDMLFPVAKGGAVAVPGGFGTGKTIIQHSLAKWSDADIIIFIGCGERGNEMTDVLNNFPKLKDPRSGLPLMERTIMIANTSNMPVAAREASIYTGATLAEYYRDMGYHVAVMADSTSRWAEALRELSGRMEEMPADEGFPAYLPTRLAEFYERASLVKSAAGKVGSVTIIGSVSPPGGDFSEPVTQHTKRFIRCFWALDRQLANARHYPSISWTDSYSEYVDEIKGWWQTNVSKDWEVLRNKTISLLNKETRLQQVVKLVGPDVLPDSQKIILTACQLIKDAFLQQSAFDKIDMFSVPQKQYKMLDIIISFYELALERIKKGSTLVKIRKLPVYSEIMRMKFNISNDQINKLDELKKKLEESFASLGGF